MATYKRLDQDQLDYLLLFLLTKLKSSPLAVNTTYSISQDATNAHKFMLTGSDDSSIAITMPDDAYDDSALKAEVAKKATSADLAAVAKSGAYSDLSGKPSIPAAASAAPKMDGTAAVGTGITWARADHVHPHDTAKADKATTLSGYGISDAYTKSQVDSAIASAVAGITGISFSIVTSLPTAGTAGTIYLIADKHSDNNDNYDEYIYVNSAWEKLGNTDVDLSGYVKQSDLSAFSNSEIESAVNSAYTSVFGS